MDDIRRALKTILENQLVASAALQLSIDHQIEERTNDEVNRGLRSLKPILREANENMCIAIKLLTVNIDATTRHKAEDERKAAGNDQPD